MPDCSERYSAWTACNCKISLIRLIWLNDQYHKYWTLVFSADRRSVLEILNSVFPVKREKLFRTVRNQRMPRRNNPFKTSLQRYQTVVTRLVVDCIFKNIHLKYTMQAIYKVQLHIKFTLSTVVLLWTSLYICRSFNNINMLQKDCLIPC